MFGQNRVNVFGMTSIEFLGDVFDINGVKMSDSRVQVINDSPESTSINGVRIFIGRANYFRDFVTGLFSHMIPHHIFDKEERLNLINWSS